MADTNIADELAAFVATKPWYFSRGVIGPALGVVATALGWAGVTIDEETRALFLDLLDNVWFQIAGLASVIGSAFGIWGRIVADKKVTK